MSEQIECGKCYELILESCGESFELPTGLNDGDEIHFRVIDKFGKEFRGKAEVDLDGNIELVTADWPQGIFNPHAGIFRFEVISVNEIPPHPICELIPLTICERRYNCVRFSFAAFENIDSEVYPYY